MTTPTTARIVRFTANADRDCASQWDCLGIRKGTRAGFTGEHGPRPICEACAERIEDGETGETPAVEPLCECTTRSGFTGRPDGMFVCASCGRPAALPETTSATHRTVDVVEPAQPDAAAAAEVGDVARLRKVELLEDRPAISAGIAAGLVDAKRAREAAAEAAAEETVKPADQPAAPLVLAHRGRGDWTVNHEPTGVAVLTSLRNRRAAQEALDRLAALPIRWDAVVTETRPAVGEGNLALPERTVSIMADPTSKRLILTEQERILGIEPPTTDQAPDEPATTEDTRGEVTATAVLSGGPREEGAPAPDTTATGPDAGTAAPAAPEPPRDGLDAAGLRILVTASRHLGDPKMGRDRDADLALVHGALVDTVVGWHVTVCPRGDDPRCTASDHGAVTIVHGDAKGGDQLAAAVARKFGWTVEAHPADWRTGKAAGVLRNGHMVALGADRCVALPLGESPGTRDCMAKAAEAGIPLTVVDVPSTPAAAPPVDAEQEAEAERIVAAKRKREADERRAAHRAELREWIARCDNPADLDGIRDHANKHSDSWNDECELALAARRVELGHGSEPGPVASPPAAAPAEQPDPGWNPVTPQQRGAAEVEAWVAGQPEPTMQETVEQLTQRVAAVDSLAGAGLITPYAAAHVVPPTDRAQVPAPVVDEPMPLPDLATWMPDARQWGADPAAATRDAVDAIRDGILAGDIRGRQVEIGPSEIGHECARWLAYRLAGVPPTGTEPVPWRQRIGTLVHADVDDHLARDNQRREDTGRTARWLTGIRVDVGELYPGRTITGTLDVLDVLTATVLDVKVPGSTAMRTYGKGKPERESYRVQVQLYGRGVMRAGFLPAHVGVLRVSPARELSEYIVKTEPFDAGIAERALARAGGIARMVDQLGDRSVALLPPTEATCHRCPWLRPDSTDLARGCPGAPGADLSRSTARASVDDLVA